MGYKKGEVQLTNEKAHLQPHTVIFQLCRSVAGMPRMSLVPRLSISGATSTHFDTELKAVINR